MRKRSTWEPMRSTHPGVTLVSASPVPLFFLLLSRQWGYWAEPITLVCWLTPYWAGPLQRFTLFTHWPLLVYPTHRSHLLVDKLLGVLARGEEGKQRWKKTKGQNIFNKGSMCCAHTQKWCCFGAAVGAPSVACLSSYLTGLYRKF